MVVTLTLYFTPEIPPVYLNSGVSQQTKAVIALMRSITNVKDPLTQWLSTLMVSTVFHFANGPAVSMTSLPLAPSDPDTPSKSYAKSPVSKIISLCSPKNELQLFHLPLSPPKV